MIPFLLNLQENLQKGELLKSLLRFLGFGLVVTIIITIFFAAAYATLTVVYIKTKLQLWDSILLQIAFAILATIIGIGGALYLRARLAGEEMKQEAFFSSLVFGGFILLIFLFYSAYQEARRDMLALKAAVAEARYSTLEQQMRPHFLFNALNSLAELIESGESDSAKMTQTLADLYRQILTNSGLKTAPFQSEIDIARRYLEIEKIRFGKRLEFSFQVLVNTEEVFLPTLVVQTLVENAVKHGVAKSVSGGEIIVDLAQTKSGLYQLSVINSGEPLAKSSPSGTGLENTRSRLQLLYGKRHDFSISTNESGQTVASFCFTGERIE